MRFLDTNVVIRYVTQDHPTMGPAATALFRRVDEGLEEVTTCEGVVAEVVFVLSSPNLYNLGRVAIRDRVAALLSFRGFRLHDKRVYLHALDLYATDLHLDFEDCLCVAHMGARGIPAILSYDRDFDRVAEVTRVEP